MKPKPTPLQRALKFHAAMLRTYTRSERALIRAALVGCTRPDPTEPNRNEASSSGRDVDVTHEVQELRFDRNGLTMAERELKRAKAKPDLLTCAACGLEAYAPEAPSLCDCGGRWKRAKAKRKGGR